MPVIQVNYDKKLIQRALKCYFLHRLGWLFFVLIVGLLAWLLFSWVYGLWGTVETACSAVLLVVISVCSLAYYGRLKQSNAFLSKTESSSVTFTLNETGIETKSDLGCSRLNWNTFDEVLKFKDVWLLVYASNAYIAIPSTLISSESQQLIDKYISN